MKSTYRITATAIALSLGLSVFAQDHPTENKKESQIKFTIVKEAKCTDVKNQNTSSTCWCFSTESFLESEFMRMGKGPVDISEMWIVRAGYIEKAKKYMRMMGKTNFGPGGEPHDVIHLSAEYGIVPQSVYPGLPPGEDKVKQNEMDNVLKAILDAQLKLDDGKLNPNWLKAFTAALDAYLGAPVENFKVDGKSYTPKSYADFLGFKPEDYIAITSFTHHPFWQPFVLEIPDNWAWGLVNNVPLDDMTAIALNATANGYTVAWGSDISEPFFSFRNGMAVVPEKDWADMSKGERDSLWIMPSKDKEISQQYRQDAFDDLSTQDDHGMQLTGQATDQTGKKYFIVKNSWGTDHNEMKGYFYCSEAYFRYKTTSIMVHKSAIPKDIAAKMKL